MGHRRHRRRKRRTLQQNPVVTSKLLLVGGITLAGGFAAYKLLKPAGTLPPGPPPDPSAGLAERCAALQSQLVRLRAQATPPVAEMRNVEQQLNACIAASREAGAPVDASTEALSAGDAANASIDGSFSEYKTVDYADALRRNNIRGSILQNGESMARQYAEAITQATTPEALQLARSSIARAIDSSRARRDCYYYDQRGCGRLGVNEDHGNDKAAQENDRVIVPLVAAYDAVASRLGSGGIAPYADAYVNPIVRSAQTSKDYADAKYGEYKTVDYADALRRNNLRQEIFKGAEDAVARLAEAYSAAALHNSRTAMRAAAMLSGAVLNAAIDRWTCYISDQPGCGRFGVNEDHGNDKGAQEVSRVIGPLTTISRRMAAWLSQRGDTSAYTALVNTKLRLCRAISDHANRKYAEYKSVSYTDAIRRNNLRQEVLGYASALAPCYAEAYEIASADGIYSHAPVSMELLTRSSGLMFQPPGGRTGTSGYVGIGGYVGLGQVQLTAMAPLFTQFTQAPISLMPTTSATVVSSDPNAPSILAAMRLVAGSLKLALDAAVQRRICYLFDQPGCGRFGVNEAHGNDKAVDENNRVIGPLTAVYDRVVAFLVARGDTQAEVPLVDAKLRLCAAQRDYADARYAELKSVGYTDAVRRNNVRGEIIRAGRDFIACVRAASTATPAGRKVVRDMISTAIVRSRGREQCYQSGSPGCGRWGWIEPHENDKAAEERDQVRVPLEQLLSSMPALGQTDNERPASWFGVGVVAAVGIGAIALWPRRALKRNRRRRSKTGRRTSRRIS